MKVKKIEDILLYIGAGSVLFGLILFLLAPLFGNAQFDYNGFQAFGLGFVSLFTFASPAGILLFFLFVISVICLILWGIQVARKESTAECWIKFSISAVSIVILFAIASGMFAAKVTFNGNEEILFEAISKAGKNGFAKFIAMLSVALAYLSLMMNTLYAFVNFGMLNLVGPDYRELKLPFSGKK